ncbi:hypothetical protein [uncultured Brevundimonas sp.]|uniref:DUF7146 domain-containing protein n=1 Tax=uncultured Brevundimonas sp. TaxID=213418 RepID=UPI002614E2F0|nr:hypothetical protein [uncultured Brevundimonas sp.]
MSDLSELFDRAREKVKVSEVAGGKLGRVGRRLRGECRVCKAGEGKLKDGPFWVDDATGRWGCFAGLGDCARGGDAIRLEQLMRGGSPREIAERFAGETWTPAARTEIVSGPAPAAARERGADPEAARKAEAAARIARESRRISPGSLVDRYLEHRRIGGAVREVMCAELRYHPEAFYGVVPDGVMLPPGAMTTTLRGGRRGLILPAMVAIRRTHHGRTGGVHLTFLRADGRGKARVKRAKTMLGPQTGHGRPGGALLSPMNGDWAERPLIVAEGIETTGSAAELYAQQFGAVPRMAAALSLGALSGGWRADERGRYDVDTPSADPARPAFTWPEAGAVWIAVDRDMGPVTVPVRGPGGRRRQRRLDSDDRARVCGALATQAWREAGANPVRVIAPAAGLDFNDQLQESGE